MTVRDDGTIGVTYYDFRNNTADPSTLPTDLWLAQSGDGVTWRESHVTGPFDLSIAPDAEGLFLGDYHGLTSIGATIVPFYVRTNNGNPGNRTDVFAGLVNSTGKATKAASGNVSDMAAPWTAEVAPPGVMTPDLALRLHNAARRALERRMHGQTPPVISE